MNILEHLITNINFFLGKKISFLGLSFFLYIDKFLNMLNSVVFDTWRLFVNTYGVEAVVMSIKFLLSIALLIFIRGGIPRYRFDHLTRIGWVKFLTLVVCFLLIEIVFIYTLMS